MFHRLEVPTYFGGLPVGYDYINTPSDPSVGGTGVPSFTDGKKSGGPNDGTYMIAFGEDATSSFANRGLKALAQNTDQLDNMFRRDIALTARTADVLASLPVSSFTIAGSIFVGELGVSNTQATRDLLVSVLDSNDNEIITAGGTKVVAALIHDGANTNVVGTQTSGFFSTPTVNLNAPIPAGVTYRVYYGFRSNLASLPKDAFTNIKIRGAQEVSGEVERVLRDLHSVVPGPSWNDPFAATIGSLARTGLDGRYRLTTVDPGPSTVTDTPGSGGYIIRDGQALSLLLPVYALDTLGVAGVNNYPDPMMAALRLTRLSPIVSTSYNLARGGDVGFTQESPYHTTSDANEVSSSYVTGPLLLDVIPRDLAGSTLSGNPLMTRIGAANLALANPDSLTDATSRRTIQVNASDFLRDGSGRSALRQTDLIEVISVSAGKIVGTYRVDQILSTSRFTVKALTGANPPLGPSGASASIKIRWLQPTISIGGRHRAATGATFSTPHFMVAAPGPLTSNYNAERPFAPNALFLSSMWQRDVGATSSDLFQALAWGGFDTSGYFTINGELQGDGGIQTTAGKQRLNFVSTNNVNFTVGNGGRTIDYNPQVGGHVEVYCSATSNAPVTFNVVTTGGYSRQIGDSFTMLISIAGGTTGTVSFAWPADFKFSGADDEVSMTNLSASTIYIKYRFTLNDFSVGGPYWFAERWDY